jgi:histidinol-phosphate aminotransferase
VIAGSGSEGIMSGIIRTFLCDDDEVLTTDAAFIGFQVLARSRGVKYRTVPYRDWHYDLAALAGQITENTKIVYLANPNNPTGTIFTRHEFDSFYRHVPERVLIILDEAYFEYAKDNPRYPDSMHYRYDNVITLRTFSKIYGLAGIRIGYGFAHEDLIANLLKVKLPFEPSTLAQAAGIGALADKEFLHRSLELNARGLRLLTDSFRGMGLEVVPSDANFVMLPLPSAEEARALTEALLREGVIVRPLGRSGCRNACAYRPGTDEENARAWKRYGEQLCFLTEIANRAQKDFLPLNGTDYVEFYVGNAKQAAYFYRSAFGMRLTAYRGPETGTRDRASWVVEQGKIRLVLTTALSPIIRLPSTCACMAMACGTSRCGWTMRNRPTARPPGAAPGACASRRPCATSRAKCASPPSPLTAIRSTLSSSGATIAASFCPASCRSAGRFRGAAGGTEVHRSHGGQRRLGRR